MDIVWNLNVYVFRSARPARRWAEAFRQSASYIFPARDIPRLLALVSLFVAGAASVRAADECGSLDPNGGTVQCAPGDYPDRIEYFLPGPDQAMPITVEVGAAGTPTTVPNGISLQGDSNVSTSLVIHDTRIAPDDYFLLDGLAGVYVQTNLSGNRLDGVPVRSDTTVDGSTIDLSASGQYTSNAMGIYVLSNANGPGDDTRLTVRDGGIAINGDFVNAISVSDLNQGDVHLDIQRESLNLQGDVVTGIYVTAGGSATVTLNNPSADALDPRNEIQIFGAQAHVASVVGGVSGNDAAVRLQVVDVSAHLIGAASTGYEVVDASNNAGTSLEFDYGGQTTIDGDHGRGVVITGGGHRIANLNSVVAGFDPGIHMSGVDSDAIVIQGNGQNEINFNGSGNYSGGSGNGVGLRIEARGDAAHTQTVVNLRHGTIGALSGQAIVAGDTPDTISSDTLNIGDLIRRAISSRSATRSMARCRWGAAMTRSTSTNSTR